MRYLTRLIVAAVLAATAGAGIATMTASPALASCSRNIITGPANNTSVMIEIEQSCGRSYRSVGLWGGGSYDGYHYGTYHLTNEDLSLACADKNCDAGNVLWGGYERKTDGKEWCFYNCANAPANVIRLATGIHTTALSKRCVAPWDQAVEPSNPGWGEADWEGQTCGFAMQVRSRCTNRFTGVDEYSGIVTGNETEDRASCTTSFPSLARVSINFRESGFWTGWCEIWPTFSNCTTVKSTAIHTTALVSKRTASTVDLSSGGCHNEWVYASSNLDGTKPEVQWVKGGGTTVNGCGWQLRCHAHFGIPRAGDDDGWVDGGWVTSSTVSGCNSPDGDGWFVFDLQWRTGPGATVHTVRVAP